MEDSTAKKMFRTELTDNLRESTKSDAQAMGSISESIMRVSNALAQILQLMSQSIAMPQNPYSYRPQGFGDHVHNGEPMQNTANDQHGIYQNMLNEPNRPY